MINTAWKTGLGLAAIGVFMAAAGERARSEPDELARYDRRIKPQDRAHWAFQPVRPVPPPAVKNTAWVRTPIDRFILATLEAKGWQPAPAAEPGALLRRVYLDLIGLPPTPQEQDRFLRATSAEAIDGVVAELLTRPSYGERWGRHWLDLVRFAESNGYERDGTKPFAWRYRDYVIEAFNRDKPYDRFVLEQLAGDELPHNGAWHERDNPLLATGYYRLGPWDDEPANPQEDRFDQLEDMVNTTSQVFLGLTLACARCHNHKFESLTMHDYYRMVAVFNPLQRPRNGRTELDLPVGTPLQIEAEAVRQRDLAQLQRAADPLRRQLIQAHLAVLTPGATALPTLAKLPGLQSPALRSTRGDLERNETERGRLNALPKLSRGYFLHEPPGAVPATFLLIRGQAARPGPEVQPGVPAVLTEAQPAFRAGSTTSGRRLTLARWIAHAENPLTARVIVNRVWQHHFGQGLVRTPSDFGTRGERPTHPELLDWLAGWFVREGWSLKKLHALIIASNAYRMSQRFDAEYATVDPENRLLWRMPRTRLEVEVIRDAMLAASGHLNPRMFGPSVLPPISREALDGHSDPDKVWKPSGEREAARRTVYVFLKRSMLVPLLEVLDLCDTARSAAQRNVTSVAPQALAMFNGDFVNRQAQHLADRLRREAGHEPERQVELGYRLVLCRPPNPVERAALLDYLVREAEQRKQEAAHRQEKLNDSDLQQQALTQMCRVLFNLNEFVYAD